MNRSAEITPANGSVNREGYASVSRRLRDSLRQFATGVTVIATRKADGVPVGLTASSFNTVSPDPPLALWSLSRKARSLPLFMEAPHFGASVLGAHQMDLAVRFASPIADRFAGIEWSSGKHGVPLWTALPRGSNAAARSNTMVATI